MKILTIIGTRPQYIKVAPLYHFLSDKHQHRHVLVDTNQHSSSLCGIIKRELGLKIDFDYNLCIKNLSNSDFLGNCIKKVGILIEKEKPDVVIAFGDTNSTLAVSIAANKKHIPLAHIEAGIRCGDRNRPEEINRILTDELANIHFISRKKDAKNVSNPIYTGDLEYSLLHAKKGKFPNIRYENYLLMTIHRYQNLNVDRLQLIFDKCKEYGKDIYFCEHPHTKMFINKHNIILPSNIKLAGSWTFTNFVSIFLCSCKGIISDSGGVTKLCPFFGKKIFVPFKYTEWDDVIEKGYGILEQECQSLSRWFEDYEMPRDENFYYNPDTCEIILDTLETL